MIMPFQSGFYIASPYGLRKDPITGEENVWHGGVDLVGNDRNVRAVSTGYVLQSRMVPQESGNKTWEWGNYVSIMGDDGIIVYYCHLEKRLVEAHDRITAGETIGIEGTTGRSTGIHLHFEVRNAANIQQDPCKYLGIPNRQGYEYDPPEPWEEQSSPWAVEGVRWAVENGILRGDGKGDYRLKDSLIREEMCVLLWRTMGNGV